MRASPYLIFAFTSLAVPLAAQQGGEIDNVAAFARLYGVARYFYPSDAAAALDWNRFAVYGVSRVRAARTPAQLETTLEELFTPLGPGIEIGRALPAKRPQGNPDASLVAWRYRGAGMSASARGPYSAKRTNRIVPRAAQSNGFANTMQSLPADTLRGKTIRMRGRMRVADPNVAGWAGLWLRVDRGGPQQQGFFDNMQNRPVRDTAWREYIIEGPIAPDATQIYFGALGGGAITADVDAIELAVRSEGGTWTPLTILDASFEALPDSGRNPKAWSQSGVNGNYVFTRPTSGAFDGQRFARMAPATVPAPQAPELPIDAFETPVAGATIHMALTRGLNARVPLSLTDADARIAPALSEANVSPEPAALAGLRSALATLADPRGRFDVDVRLADVIVAWNVFRHFYPYWTDIGVNWDARLHPQLTTALNAATTRDAHTDAVRIVVAEVRDGHGNVYDVAAGRQMGTLPLQLRILDGRLVVTGTGEPDVPIGSVVKAIDGTPAADRFAKEMQLASGTLQWRQFRAAREVLMCRAGSTVKLSVEQPSGSARDATLPCERVTARALEPRPDTIAELEPGIWYVDLTRARAAQVQPVLEKLANARGVVFDVRGYPTDAGAQILPYLMNAAESDQWMHVSAIAGPFGEIADWRSFSWNLRPATPHIAARRVFLTDGRAISYAESVMGYVRDHKLATIIGGTTAGTNGNIADFTVPGGFSIVFTGMRVTRHDGRTPFHLLGVTPDIPLEPTLAGIRAGRDELLERALIVLRASGSVP